MAHELEHPGELVGEFPSARTFTDEIAPHWNERVAELLFRQPLPKNSPAHAIDIHCAHGHTTLALANKLHPESRILALQAEPSLSPIAQGKLRSHKGRVDLKDGNFDEVTTLADSQFDFVCANLVLGESVPDWQQGFREMYRLLKPGGQARATLALKGTWHDATQLVLETLRTHHANWAHDQLQLIEQNRPTPESILEHTLPLTQDLRDIGVSVERFEILFANARDFFASPLVHFGPLALWRALVRNHQNPGAMLWSIKEAFDAHYENHVLALPIVVSAATLRKPGPDATERKPLAYEALKSHPQLRKLCFGAPTPKATQTDLAPPKASANTSHDLSPPATRKKASK